MTNDVIKPTIEFLPVQDVQVLWRHAPILRAAVRTLHYLIDNGPIGLTGSMALPARFVEWAAEVFEWPGYSLAELYGANSELEEHHFPPLEVLHDVLVATRLARHDRGHLAISGFGQVCVRAPARLWELITCELLFNTDHCRYVYEGFRFDGDWDMILEVLNLTVDAGADEAQICEALLQASDIPAGRDPITQLIIFMNVVRPLTWAGLLAEVRSGSGAHGDCVYVKTPLWRAALALPCDAQLPIRALH